MNAQARRTICLIGLGRQGSQHLKALEQVIRKSDTTIVGLCDVRTLDHAYAYPVFHDYNLMLSELHPSTVVITTPNNLHKEITLAAIKNGADVIKEKPLALSEEDGQEMQALALQHHRTIVTLQQRYHTPIFMKLKTLIDEYRDAISHFSYSFTVDDQKQGWYWDRVSGGGSWLNLGWHGLALTHWLFGPPKNVEMKWNIGGMRDWKYSTDHSSLAQLMLESGMRGNLFFSCVHPKEETLKVSGSHMSILFSRNKIEVHDHGVTRTFHAPSQAFDPYVQQYQTVFDQLDSHSYDMKKDIEILHSIQLGILSAEKGKS